MRTLGHRAGGTLGVVAVHAHQECAVVVDVQALSLPAHQDPVAARERRNAYGVDVGAHDENAVAGCARARDGLGVERRASFLRQRDENCLGGAAADRLQRLAGRELAGEARKPERRDDRAVGFEQVVLRQIVRLRPGECLRVQRLRQAFVVGHLPDVQQDAPVGIFVAQPDQRARRAHGDAELFGQLALQPLEGFLARGQLAAREFPAPGHVAAAWPLRDQHTAVRVGNRARDDMDFSRAFHPWPPRDARGNISCRRPAMRRGSA
jgi:hypothetical protein